MSWPLDVRVAQQAADDVLGRQQPFLRSIDYGLIGGRLDALYEFAARSLGEPRVEGLVRDGMPAYVWPSDAREPWLGHGRGALPRLLAWATGAQQLRGRRLRDLPQE